MSLSKQFDRRSARAYRFAVLLFAEVQIYRARLLRSAFLRRVLASMDAKIITKTCAVLASAARAVRLFFAPLSVLLVSLFH